MWRAVALTLVMACQARGPIYPSETGTPDPTIDPTTDDTEPTDEPSPCLAGPDTPGPWAGHPIAAAGRTTTTVPYDFDASLDDVIAAATTSEPTPVSIAIDGAVVTSIDYVPSPNDGTATFWLEDANGAARAFFVDTGALDPVDLEPGDIVKFTVTELHEYFGAAEITAVADFEVIGEASIYVVDGNTGAPLDPAVDGQRTVEVWGELVSGPTDCESNCFDMEYAGGMLIYRSDSKFDRVGDCIQYIGPLSSFKGGPQLDVRNFDWYRAF